MRLADLKMERALVLQASLIVYSRTNIKCQRHELSLGFDFIVMSNFRYSYRCLNDSGRKNDQNKRLAKFEVNGIIFNFSKSANDQKTIFS